MEVSGTHVRKPQVYVVSEMSMEVSGTHVRKPQVYVVSEMSMEVIGTHVRATLAGKTWLKATEARITPIKATEACAAWVMRRHRVRATLAAEASPIPSINRFLSFRPTTLAALRTLRR